MNDLTNYFIDLSKLSEDKQKHIISLLPEPETPLQHNIDEANTVLHYDDDDDQWWVNGNEDYYSKTELLYPEFIKLFEGAGGINYGWIKIESEADLPKESGEYFVFNGEAVIVEGFRRLVNSNRKMWLKLYTHYQIIIKPLPPEF